MSPVVELAVLIPAGGGIYALTVALLAWTSDWNVENDVRQLVEGGRS